MPSGDQTGLFSNVLAPVSAVTAPLATSTTAMCVESSLPLSGATVCAKAILLPSGDHERPEGGLPGGSTNSSVQLPLVIRFASPPATDMIQMCCGRIGFRRKMSCAPTSKVVLNFSSPSFFASSSSAPYAIAPPSGRQLYCSTPPGCVVSLRASPPFIGISHTCMALAESGAMNASVRPSGDQCGAATTFRPGVRARGAPPASSTA